MTSTLNFVKTFKIKYIINFVLSIIFYADALKKSSGSIKQLKPVEVKIDKRKEEVLEISVKPGGLPQRIIIASKQLSRFAK